MTADAQIYQGEHRVLNVTVWANVTKTLRRDLAGASAEYRIGHKNHDELVLRVTATPNAAGSSVAISDPTNGIIAISLRQADTDALAARKYSQQVWVTDSSGKPVLVMDGFLTVGESIPNA